MMAKFRRWTTALGLLASIVAGTMPTASIASEEVSGRLESGYRILSVSGENTQLHFKVYRGDYVRFELSESEPPTILKMPDLGVEQQVTSRWDETPRITMRRTGRFAFTIGDREGTLEVVEFRRASYREMTAGQAAEFTSRQKPLILDVRTPAEFKRGHLPNAKLIPVQELQRRLKELAPYRDKDILVYCATGNRSTVASKIMIDRGFTRITNLRHGIVDWQHKKFPVVN